MASPDISTGIGQIEPNSAEDISIKAFEAYSKANFQMTIK